MYPPFFQIFLFRRRANCSNDLWLLIDMECRIITNSVQIRSAGSTGMTTARYVNVKASYFMKIGSIIEYNIKFSCKLTKQGYVHFY